MKKTVSGFSRKIRLIPCLGGILLFWTSMALGQELEPRSFSQTPVGMNFAAVAYSYASGEVLFDQAVPITDAEGRVSNVAAAYVRTLDFFGASAKLTGVIPYAWGAWDGLLNGEYAATSRSGFADPQVKLSVNFLGAPAMTMSQMRNYTKKTVVGTSLLVTVPVGQYDSEKLINLGQNRWSFRPRVGISHEIGRWTVESMASVWLYTENPDFYGGHKVSQDPLWSLQFDAVYQFRRGFWMGVGAGFSRGGKVASDGVYGDSYKKNSRWAALIAYPITATQSVKVTYINGLRTRLGSDFDQVSVAYQVRWGGVK